MTTELENKIIDIEIRFAHQQDHIEQLDQVIYQHQQIIDQLKEKLQLLEKRLKASMDSNILKPEEDSPPPHY